MKNRLQFNRHYAEFQSREDALTALKARITDPGFIPLIGEPIVFRYKDENDNLQVILAIGKKAGHNLDERDYHVIDTADLDEKIAAEVAAREALDAETIKRIIFDGVENTFEDNVATLSVSANSIPIGAYEEYDGRATRPHPIHDDYSVLEAVKQVDTNFISFLDDTNAKIDGIHIVKVTSGLDANVREAYDLVNLSGYPQPNSERILIYKDSSLYDVYLGHTDDRLDDYTSPVVTPGTGDTALCFIYLKADSTYQLVAINVEDFLQENEFEDGFVVDNHVVKVKIDQLSEPFLTVSADGVKLAGVQDAIDAAQQAEEDRAVSAETAIQAELDATQTGAGLDTDGSYIHDHSANYVDEATSLANADHLLDAALKAESDRAISAETAETARATAAEGTLQNNIDAEETRATAAETTLQNNIDAEESRAITAEGTLQDNIDAEETRATAAEASISGAVDTLSAATVSGITNLNNKIDAEEARATAAETSISEAVNTLSAATISEVARLDAAIASGNTNVNALSGAVVSEIARAENAEQAIQNELNATQTGAGLAADGSYIHDHPTTYIGVATSLANADHLLDEGLKNESDRAASAETALQGNIDAEEARATAAEDSISTAIANEATRATNAEAGLQTAIDNETARATAEETSLSQAISAEATRAQGAESTLDSKVSALSAGTESKLNSLDGKIDAETQRAEAAEDAIDGRVDALSGVTASFSSATVSEIARIDATITGNKVKSTGNTIVVTEYGNGTNLEAHIDGETILSDNGELKTGLKFISLPVGELEANVREAFKLADAQGNPVDNTTIKIYKSSSLVSLELVNVGGTDYIRVTYINNSGVTETMDLNIQQLVFETEFKDGLTVNANHEVRVEIDPTSDAYLTVSSNGVKLSGIQNAIDTSVATETTRATGAENALRTDATTSAATLQGAINAEETRATAAENSISGNVNTLSGATVSGLQYISGVTDNIINACGLNTGSQGGYIPHSDTHFIGGARSLDQADVLLDQAIWALSGAAGGDITGLVSDVRNLSGETVSIDGRLTALSAATVALSAGTVSELNDLDTRLDAVESAITANTGVTELSAATVGLSAGTVFELGDLDTRVTALENASTESSGVTKLSAATIDLSAGTVSEFSDVNSDIASVRANVDTLSGVTGGVNDKVSNLSGATAELKTKVNELSGTSITLRANTNSISGATVALSNGVSDLSAATVTLSSATSTLSTGVGKLSAFTEYLSARTLGVLTVSLNGTEQGKYCPSASTTVEVGITGADVPLTGYEIATGSTLEELIVESTDTANEAFGKLQKQIYDNEQVVAQAFNDVNDRIVELSGKSMDASDYYTKDEVDSKLQKQFSTGSSISNLTLDKYLTVATITGSSSAATLGIAQSNGGWDIADGEVMEAHVIIKNNTSAPSLAVTLPTEQSDSRVRVVGNKQLIIPHNSLGEVTALITRSGNNYIIYLSTSAQESLGEEYINATFNNNPVGANATSNTFTLNCQNINLSTLGYDAGGSVGITSCDLATSSVTFAENTEYSDREIILSLTGTSTVGNPVTGTSQFTQSQRVVTPSLSIAYTGAGESAAAGSTAAFTLTKNYINVITGYAVNNGASVTNTGQTGLTVQFPANQTENTKQYTVSVSGTDVYGATKTASTVFNQDADTYTLSITPASDTVGATSVGYINFTVSSTNVSNSGLTYAGFITGASRTGNAISVLYTENTGSTSRNGTVTITGKTVGGRTVSATGTLTQNGAAATSLSITYTGGTLTAQAGTTTAFTVVASNVTVTGYSATPPATATQLSSGVEVSYPANTEEESDVAYTVTVLGQDEFGRTVSAECDVLQAADTYEFSVTPGTQTVAWDATQTTFTVAATNVSNIGYYSTDSQNINSCTKNGNVFTASISANQADSPKIIKFVASGQTLGGRTVYASGTTSQNGKPESGNLTVSLGSWVEVDYQAGTNSFIVDWENLKVGEQITFATTNISSCEPSAITINSENVTGFEEVTVHHTENTGSTTRYITFSASSIDQTNTPVSGSEYYPQTGARTFSVSPTSVSLVSGSTNSTLTIVTNTSWSVTSNQSWCTLSRNSGSGSGTVTIYVTANTGGTRSATLTFTVANIGNRTVSVSQAAAPSYNYTFYYYGLLGEQSSCYGSGYGVNDGDDEITFNNGFEQINCSLSGYHGMHDFEEDDCTIVMRGGYSTAQTYTSYSSAASLNDGKIVFNGAIQSLPDCIGGGYGGAAWILKIRIYDHGYRGNSSYLKSEAYSVYAGSSSSDLDLRNQKTLSGTIGPGSYDVEIVLTRGQDSE